MLWFKKQNKLDVQEKIIETAEEIQTIPKALLVVLAATTVLSIPMAFVLAPVFYGVISKSYSPPKIIYVKPDPKPLSVVDKQFFYLGGKGYYGYARVLNPNTNLAARSLKYKFTFVNSSETAISAREGVTYILPGQERFLFVPPADLEERPADLRLDLDAGSWARTESFSGLNFNFEQIHFGQDSDGQYFASAVLRNGNPYFIPEMEIGFLLYDARRSAVAANHTFINDLKVEEKRFFRVVWPKGANFPTAADVEFKPSVNQLDRNSLLLENPSNVDYSR